MTMTGRFILFLAFAATAFAAPRVDLETYMLPARWKMLDTFEAYALQKADKSFAGKEYTKAGAEYKTFIVEFPRSKAIPYALLRRGRCKQLVDKRFEAIKLYEEVLDYFPDDVNEAAAALFYLGECEHTNGNLVEAMKAYAEIAEDEEYRQHKLAAGAIYELAINLKKQERYRDAAEEFARLAVEWRKDRADIAVQSIRQAQEYYALRAPDKPTLRELWQDALGFHEHKKNKAHLVPANEKDPRKFWEEMLVYIDRYSKDFFKEDNKEQRSRIFKYWSDQMANKHQDWDHYQIRWANYGFLADGNQVQRIARLEKQFERGQKDDWDRVILWINELSKANASDKAVDYAKKIDYNKASPEQVVAAMSALWDSAKNPAAARKLIEYLDMPSKEDAFKVSTAWWFAHRRDLESFQFIIRMVEDRPLRDSESLKYYMRWKDAELLEKEGLPICERLIAEEKYADAAYRAKAEIYYILKKWEECIQALRNFPNAEVHSFFRIADCFIHLKKPAQAIQQLREIENFFPPHASQAVYRISEVHRKFNQQKQEVQALHEIMLRYKKTSTASKAHLRLEQLGVSIRGGEDATAD